MCWEARIWNGRLGALLLATVALAMIDAPPSSAAATCPGFEADARNQVVGTPGRDQLDGTSGDDVICGLGDLDIIHALGGNDLVIGGPGGGDSGGDDTIEGGDGDDVLFGGEGGDYIDGGDGNDQVFGELGADFLVGDPGTDLMDGGEESAEGERQDQPLLRLDQRQDGVAYLGRTTGVSMSLDNVANDGSPGEGDQLLGIERLTGGPGDDRLIGDEFFNFLLGLGGDDVIIGGGGLQDVAYGDEGNDYINLFDGSPTDPSGAIPGSALSLGVGDDVFKCGNGDPGDVAVVDWDDGVDLGGERLLGNCNKVIEPAVLTLKRTVDGFAVPVTCVDFGRCQGKIKLDLPIPGGKLSVAVAGTRHGAATRRYSLAGASLAKTRRLLLRPTPSHSTRRTLRRKAGPTLDIRSQNKAVRARRLHRVRIRG